MGAGRQRWWVGRTVLAEILDAYRDQEQARRDGLAPFTDRVHSRRYVRVHRIETRMVVDPKALMDDEPVREEAMWVSAWAEKLLDATFLEGDAVWREAMIARAQRDKEFRAGALAVLDLGGCEALRSFAEAEAIPRCTGQRGFSRCSYAKGHPGPCSFQHADYLGGYDR